jgi:hypothetical protein
MSQEILQNFQRFEVSLSVGSPPNLGLYKSCPEPVQGPARTEIGTSLGRINKTRAVKSRIARDIRSFLSDAHEFAQVKLRTVEMGVRKFIKHFYPLLSPRTRKFS